MKTRITNYVFVITLVLASMLAFVSRAPAQSLNDLKQQYQDAVNDVSYWQNYLDTTDFDSNIQNAEKNLQDAQSAQVDAVANIVSLEIQEIELQDAINNYDPGSNASQILDLEDQINQLYGEIDTLSGWGGNCDQINADIDQISDLNNQINDLYNAYYECSQNENDLLDVQAQIAIANGDGVAAAQAALDNALGDHDHAEGQLNAAVIRRDNLWNQINGMGGW